MSDQQHNQLAPRLPLELLEHTFSFLQLSGASGTLASVQQCTRPLYAAVTPHLYHELYFTQRSVFKLLKLYESIPVEDRYHLYKVLDNPRRPWKFDKYPAVLRLRAVMTRVEKIVLGDVYEDEELQNLLEKGSKILGPVADITNQPFFTELRDLVIYPQFMQHLEDVRNEPSALLKLICSLSQPERICIHLPTLLPPSLPRDGPSRQRIAPWHHALDGLSYLDAAQVTLHNVTSHSIRRTASLPMGIPGERVDVTIHFVEPPGFDKHDEQGNTDRIPTGLAGLTRAARIQQIADPIRDAIRLIGNPAAIPSSSSVGMGRSNGDTFLARYTYFYPLAGVIDLDPMAIEGLSDVNIMAEFAEDVLEAIFAHDPRRDGKKGPTKDYISKRLTFLQGAEAARTSPCWGHSEGYC